LAEAASAVECAFRSRKTEHISCLIDALDEALAPAIAAVNSMDGEMAAL
jgi:hypothetical protein